MAALAHHALLAAGVAALGSAALRLVSTLTPRGLERLVAAAPVAGALAVVWPLALGLAGLGANPWALLAAAAASWLAVRAVAPAPEHSLGAELSSWWQSLARPQRAGAGAAAGVLVAYGAFLVRNPQLGTDAVIYHLADVVSWVGNGSPGSSVDLVYGLPVGNYPQTFETQATWVAALSDGFVFPALLGVAFLVLLALSGWLGLRRLGADRVLTALGVAALCSAPLAIEAARTAGTDLPALAWLAAAGALVACSTDRPSLLAPALVAAALGIGTKTTVAPLALLLIAAAIWAHRSRLGEHRTALLAAGVAGAVVGGTWYARNLIGHGSPLWPLVALPGSDPVPDLVDRLDYSLLDRPGDTLSGNLDEYARRLAGYLLLFAAALFAPLVARRRVVLLAGLAAAGSLLLWLNAPFTGVGDSSLERLFLSTVRYLMPAAAAAVVCIVLAGSRGVRPFALVALAGAGAWNLVRVVDLGYPVVPSALTLLVGAAAGAVAASLISARFARWAALGGVGAVVAVGALSADGYVERHGRANASIPNVPFAAVARELAGRADFDDGDERVSSAPGVSAMLAGDRLDHELELIPEDEPCPDVEARAEDGWVVIADVQSDSIPAFTARTCFRDREPLLELGAYRVYTEIR